MTIHRLYMLMWGLSALLLLVPLSVGADEVRLANGDRLTGEIERMENSVLILKTDYAGELKLMWSEVVCISSDRELTFRLKNKEVMVGSATCPADGKIQIRGVRVGESAEIPLDELDAINPSPPPPAVRYKGNINGGARRRRAIPMRRRSTSPLISKRDPNDTGLPWGEGTTTGRPTVI